MAELGRQQIEAYLGEPHVANLTTVRPGGRPHVAPVWFLWEAGRVYVIAGNTAVKVRNVRANPAVALSIAADARPYQYVILEGQAQVRRTTWKRWSTASVSATTARSAAHSSPGNCCPPAERSCWR